ncbi:hypothetical protein BDZ45DRAFT_130940 [Acephala macrosclerotiorum]|nr:hypothetical protein BDZ45DRAFT_130940 [Acephala macrosclerotiorum]
MNHTQSLNVREYKSSNTSRSRSCLRSSLGHRSASKWHCLSHVQCSLTLHLNTTSPSKALVSPRLNQLRMWCFTPPDRAPPVLETGTHPSIIVLKSVYSNLTASHQILRISTASPFSPATHSISITWILQAAAHRPTLRRIPVLSFWTADAAIYRLPANGQLEPVA